MNEWESEGRGEYRYWGPSQKGSNDQRYLILLYSCSWGEIQPLKRGSNDLRYLSFVVYRSWWSWGRISQIRSGVVWRDGSRDRRVCCGNQEFRRGIQSSRTVLCTVVNHPKENRVKSRESKWKEPGETKSRQEVEIDRAERDGRWVSLHRNEPSLRPGTKVFDM